MKVLIIKRLGRAAPYVMDDFHDMFITLGHESLLLDLRPPADGSEQNILFSIISALTEFRPDLVIGYGATNIFPVDSPEKGVVDLFTSLGIPSISVYYDNPLDPRCFDASFDKFNPDLSYFLVWDRHYTEEMKKLGYEKAFYMPIASNTRRFLKLQYDERDAERYGADVSFVGSYTPKREIVLSTLADAGLDLVIWGYEWENVRDKRLKESNKGVADNHTELAKIYNYSKVNVNITVDQGITSLNMRVFDCMASGGFLVSDYKSDFDELFDVENEVVMYRRASELPGIVRHYLEHEDERKEMAGKARSRVLAEHSYKNRIDFIIEMLQKDKVLEPTSGLRKTGDLRKKILDLFDLPGSGEANSVPEKEENAHETEQEKETVI